MPTQKPPAKRERESENSELASKLIHKIIIISQKSDKLFPSGSRSVLVFLFCFWFQCSHCFHNNQNEEEKKVEKGLRTSFNSQIGSLKAAKQNEQEAQEYSRTYSSNKNALRRPLWMISKAKFRGRIVVDFNFQIQTRSQEPCWFNLFPFCCCCCAFE